MILSNPFGRSSVRRVYGCTQCVYEDESMVRNAGVTPDMTRVGAPAYQHAGPGLIPAAVTRPVRPFGSPPDTTLAPGPVPARSPPVRAVPAVAPYPAPPALGRLAVRAFESPFGRFERTGVRCVRAFGRSGGRSKRSDRPFPRSRPSTPQPQLDGMGQASWLPPSFSGCTAIQGPSRGNR